MQAVDEQSFSTTYAQLCKQLSNTIKANLEAEKNFRFLIISRCQKEFEQDEMEELKAKWSKEIDECNDVSLFSFVFDLMV